MPKKNNVNKPIIHLSNPRRQTVNLCMQIIDYQISCLLSDALKSYDYHFTTFHNLRTQLVETSRG